MIIRYSNFNTVNRSNEQGFTLLEIMVCVAILALVFISIFRMQSSTIDLAAAAKFNTLAPILAKKLLSDVEQDIANWSEFEGDFGKDFPAVQWRMEISESLFETEELISDDNQKKLKRIKIEIINSSDSRKYKIDTWRFSNE